MARILTIVVNQMRKRTVMGSRIMKGFTIINMIIIEVIEVGRIVIVSVVILGEVTAKIVDAI